MDDLHIVILDNDGEEGTEGEGEGERERGRERERERREGGHPPYTVQGRQTRYRIAYLIDR
ncbi:MAG: hypothetical protein MJE68_16455 [Proteobacteria bacterium]|nr:hypothetical protein [Pseudomonadota bacterium]